jgi:hypothetical protein
MRLQFLLVSLIIAIVLHAASPTRALQGTSDAPFLYYYSDYLRAFIIERADGTDSRVLGDGLMQLTDGHDLLIDGPGWSPSGNWFAWTAAELFDWGAHKGDVRPFVIRSDGLQQLHYLDAWKNATLRWSPSADLLLVAEQIHWRDELSSTPSSSLRTRFALLDASTDHAILETVDEQTFPYAVTSSRIQMRWIDPHHVIAFSYVVKEDYVMSGEGQPEYTFWIFSVDGSWWEHRYTTLPPAYFGRHTMVNGWVIRSDDRYTYVENLLTGGWMRFPLSIHVADLAWSPDGRRALIRSMSGNSAEDIWLLDVDAAQLSRVNRSARSDHNTPIHTWIGNDHILYSVRIDATNNILFHLDTDQMRIRRLALPQNTSPWIVRQWNRDNVFIGIHSFDTPQAREPLYRYMLSTGTLTALGNPLTPFYEYPFSVSPDGQYVALMENGVRITDLRSGDDVLVRPAADSWFSFNGGETSWHTSGDWLITFDDAVVVGGGEMRHIGIVNVGEGSLRDLTFLWELSPPAVGWLPSQVDPDTLPPALNEPSYLTPTRTLRGSEWAIQLSWSPDSTHVADTSVIDPYLGHTQVTVWDISSGVIVQQSDTFTPGYEIKWEADRIVQTDRTVPLGRGVPIAVSPDGSMHVINDISGVMLVNASTKDELCELGDRERYVASASFSPDSRIVAVSGDYYPVQLWDAHRCELLLTLPHQSTAIAFSPDGVWLAVGASWDVQLWSVAKLLQELQ